MKYVRFNTNRTNKEAEEIFNARIDDAKIVYDKYSNSFEKRNCPICNNDEYIDLSKFIERYSISLCKFCNTEYVNPAPSEEAISYYYNHCKSNLLYAELNLKRKSKDFRLDERVGFLEQYIKSLLKKNKKINLLEIGCNNGTFLSTLKSYLVNEGVEDRVSLYGIDLDNNAVRNKVDDSLNLQAIAAENLDTLGVSFDLIISYELIEHLVNPSEFAKNVFNNLNKDGLFILTTPNSKGLEIKAIDYNKKRFLAHSIFPPMHLNAFNTENILLFANKNMFKLDYVDTPGKLDVDMISILSEELNDSNLKKITTFPEEVKAYFQYITSYLNGSSHMRVVLSK